MPLLNYTTSVPADRTVMEISRILAKHGASAILSEYDGQGYIVALSFKINVDGNDIGFRLPTDWRPVQRVLEEQRVSPRYATDDQALRVAWRITKDWVEAQLALVQTQMARTEQVFLPYMVTNDGQTVYERFSNDSKYLLGGGS